MSFLVGMKKIILRSSLIFIVVSLTTFYLVANPVLVLNKSIEQHSVSPDSLRKHVETLCSTPEFRNFRNIESLNIAADYISETFGFYTDRVEEQAYEVEGKTYKNIIASFGPEDGKRYVIGAHYDVCYEQSGADDNASGVAGLLELARIFSQSEPELRVDLVAYTLEEPPFFRSFEMGSARHAQYCSQNAIEIEAMICLEMIGYFSEEKKSQDYPVGAMKLIYPNKGNYIAVVGKLGEGALSRKVKRAIKKGSDINVRSVNAPVSVPGIDFSDHRSYWQRGYDAVMITNTAFYRNKNYHEATDTPETLDYEKMAEVVKGVAYYILN